MVMLLRLLDEVSYAGDVIAGSRPGDLLAALALHPGGLPDGRLADLVWGEEPPAVPAKALQVLVFRLRAQAGAGLIERYDGGYRLGLATEAVDAWRLDQAARRGRAALVAGDPQLALSLTGPAADLVAGVAEPSGDGPLADLRRGVLRRAAGVERDQGLALSGCGKDAEAVPLLAAAHCRHADDTDVLVALLRSEAASAGVPGALVRYEAYRRDLADRLGVDPDEGLQRVHRELLAADEPVRSGLRYDADELLGREDDLVRLRALVRTGRLTSVLGPGGLGKTRIAHVLAREATQPRVHFVELVGIASHEDVVSEVGSALGVRNSVTGRRTLTPAQLADVRGRIAQELDSVPTLLVLDNCEHVLDATASLVAFLLATTRDLRIVTTSRAPLGIAAERVFALSQLAPADGAELLCRRARAVRPDAVLPGAVVDEIVARLDGLPLAVELAAARVRTMSAEEVRRALDDRFALLRGRDRSAPARHRTLTAVIAWSWDLLDRDEQRALAWLSVFQDGFTAEAVRDVLGDPGPDLVEALVDQSLLTVVEHDGVTRYRMLETVREFGGQRLGEADEVGSARAAQTRWAVGMAGRVRTELFGPRQVEVVDLLIADETNLADVLRRSTVAGDAADAVPLLAALGGLWAVTGNFPRFLAVADLGERLLLNWHPPPELSEVTSEAVGLVLVHLGFLRPEGVDELTEVMRRLQPPRQPWTRVARAMFVDAASSDDRRAAVLGLTDDPDRRTVAMAWQWAAILAENEGAIDDARAYVGRALAMVDADTTVWEVANLHTQRAMLALNAGSHEEAAEHARVAVPLLRSLHADEDAFSMRASIALSALRQGRLDEAERLLEDAGEPQPTDLTAGLVKGQAAAELSLARGDVEGALASFDRSLEMISDVRFAGMATSGLEPWTLVPLATCLAAHARFADTDERRRRAGQLMTDVLILLGHFEQIPDAGVDYPVTGMGLAAVGLWLLTERPDEDLVEAGVRLLALAQGFSYNRWFPVLAWESLRDLADDAAPGRLSAVLEEYGGRRGRALRPETERVLASLRTADLTSSG